MLHVESFLWYGETNFENVYRWFLHLWRLIWLMSSPSRTRPPTLCWEKSTLNWEKCHFIVRHGIVLGHKISKNGIEVDKAKIEVIAKLPVPKFIQDIWSFLGHTSFHRRFMKDFSKISRPLTNPLAKDVSFTFDTRCFNAWENLKNELISAPNWLKSFEIMCDASDFAIGAFLGQHIDKKQHVIYYSSKLSMMCNWAILQPKKNSWL